jgi:hypothetical protein
MTIATRIGRSSSCKIGVVGKKLGQSSGRVGCGNTCVSKHKRERKLRDLKPQTSRLPPFERGHMHTRVCLNDGRPHARLARLHRASRPLHRYPSLSEVWARCGALSGGGGVSCFSNHNSRNCPHPKEEGVFETTPQPRARTLRKNCIFLVDFPHGTVGRHKAPKSKFPINCTMMTTRGTCVFSFGTTVNNGRSKWRFAFSPKVHVKWLKKKGGKSEILKP